MSARREFLRRLGGLALGGSALAAARLVAQQQAPLAGQGETGALRDPGSAGRPQERKTALDNDEFVTAVEHRLQCTCGCTLDIYTCRTTDFTCTYSPSLHKDVLALKEEGKTADEIVAAFVAKYGEKVLMAPKPVGFNIAGYVVPGILILLVGGAMFLILQRRTRMRATAAGAGPVPPPSTPAKEVFSTAGGGPDASADELERLNRELRELDG
jgi:cytochrome c-type biogenesis protein CcmH